MYNKKELEAIFEEYPSQTQKKTCKNLGCRSITKNTNFCMKQREFICTPYTLLILKHL